MPLDDVGQLFAVPQTPSPQQLAADPDVSAFVTANAGSGKTKTLVDRVARLLLRGAAPEAVLCVTYTKAAAAEMQSRLFQQLGGWAVTSDDDLRLRLAELGEPKVSPRRARALFARALETPGGLKIQTIHAFCEKLLRRFPIEAGVSPTFRVAEDAAADQLSEDARAALARLVLNEPASPVARAYEHFAVELAYNHFDDLLKVLEGRRAQIARMASAPDAVSKLWSRCGFDNGETPEPDAVRRLALTPPAFDLDLWRAAAEVFGQGTATDSKCAESLRAVIAGVEAGRADFDAACSALFNKDGTPRWAKKPPKCIAGSTLAQQLAAEQDRLEVVRRRAFGAAVARDTWHVLMLGSAYGAAYEQLKKQRGMLDFGDLIARTHDLLTRRADAAWVLYKLDGGIDHVLVDEAQDTAPEQWDILKALTEEFFAGAGAPDRPGRRDGPGHTVFAVGDEKQSIYSFQGARPERLRQELTGYETLVQGAERDFRAPILAESWRSTPEVLRFVDAVFADPSTRTGVPAPVDQDVVRHTARREKGGCVDLWPLLQDEPTAEREAWDAALDAEPTESARKRLARNIAAEIRRAVEAGDAVQDKASRSLRAARWDDFLILVRRRDALFEEIIRALKKAKAPVGGADRLKLREHILTDDLLALARVALHRDDDLRLAALLRSPFWNIEEDSLYELARGRTGSLWRALKSRADERPEWRRACDDLQVVMREAPEAQPYEFYARFLARLDSQGRSMTARVLTRLGREAEDALEAFLGEAVAAQSRGVHGLESFAAALERSALEIKREQEDGRGEVRVMTVHGSKGLEAPIVILPDTTVCARAQGAALFEDGEGGFLYAPRAKEDCDASASVRALRDSRTEEESLRLLYVGLTRARDRLIICGRVGTRAKGEPERGSWYDRCRSAFAHEDCAPGVREIAASDGSTFLRFGADPLKAVGGTTETEKPELPEWAHARPAAEAAIAAYATPTELAARQKGAAPSPLSELRGLGRYRRGDLIHRLLQTLPDIEPAQRRTAAQTLLAKHRDLSDEQRSEMAGAALAVLEDPSFAEVFGPGSRAEAAIAGTSPELPAGLAVSGRVDRMVVTPGRVLVVDFKTNRPSPDRVEDADQGYLQQMAVYAAVLRAVFPGRKVEAALVWTDGPKLMPIPEEVIAATLAGLAGAR